MSIKESVMAAWHGALSPLFGEFAGEVVVECIDRAASPIDSVYGESASPKQYLPPVSLKARWKLERERLTLPGGESIDSEGRVTFRTEDLRAAGVVIDFASRLTVEGKAYGVARLALAAQVGDEKLLTKVWLGSL